MPEAAPDTGLAYWFGLRDEGDQCAWSQFVDLYAPLLVYDYGRRHGLQDADAADLMQIVLRQIVSGIKRLGLLTPAAVRSAVGCSPNCAHPVSYCSQQNKHRLCSGHGRWQQPNGCSKNKAAPE